MGGLFFFFEKFRRLAMTRRLKQHELRDTLRRSSAYLALVLGLHVAAMMAFEGFSLEESIWLTTTTAVTVGYGDLSAKTTPGRIATIVLLYCGGIFVLFHTAADYFNYRLARHARMIQGRWRWNMREHILVLNAPTINTVNYFRRLCLEFRETPQHGQRPILLVTEAFPDGLPEPIKSLGVVHTHAHATDPSALIDAGAKEAAAIIVLAEDATDKRSDATTFDILHRLRELGTKAVILAESVEDGNKGRLRAAGAAMVLRPIRFYPEIVVRGFVCPGAETILENLFTGGGDECHGYRVQLRARRWEEVVIAVLRAGLGTAIGYRSRADGHIHTNPPPEEPIDATALYLIVDENLVPTDEQMQRRLMELGLQSTRDAEPALLTSER